MKLCAMVNPSPGDFPGVLCNYPGGGNKGERASRHEHDSNATKGLTRLTRPIHSSASIHIHSYPFIFIHFKKQSDIQKLLNHPLVVQPSMQAFCTAFDGSTGYPGHEIFLEGTHCAVLQPFTDSRQDSDA